MRRRRSDDDDSSLELLLDTMCNTFGGVMFIAISIFILLASMTRDKLSEIEQSPGDPATLQQEIINLQTILTELEQKIQQRNDLKKIQQSDSFKQQLNEIIVMQQLIKEIDLKISVGKVLARALQLQKTQMEDKLNPLQQKIIAQQQKIRELQIKKEDVKQKLEKLLRSKIIQQQISFKIIKPDSKSPFFLMAQGNYVYPVGPWQTPGKDDKIDEAVKPTVFKNKNNTVISCTVNSARGVKIIENGTVSKDFLALLNRIPKNRIPKFFITPGSAKNIFIMRSYLKKNNIDHGCSIGAKDSDPFQFQYTQKADYEY